MKIEEIMILVLLALLILSIVRYSYTQQNISRARFVPFLRLRVPDQIALLETRNIKVTVIMSADSFLCCDNYSLLQTKLVSHTLLLLPIQM
jgi:hypothetical protein